jgi:hypothetical protein
MKQVQLSSGNKMWVEGGFEKTWLRVLVRRVFTKKKASAIRSFRTKTCMRAAILRRRFEQCGHGGLLNSGIFSPRLIGIPTNAAYDLPTHHYR